MGRFPFLWDAQNLVEHGQFYQGVAVAIQRDLCICHSIILTATITIVHRYWMINGKYQADSTTSYVSCNLAKYRRISGNISTPFDATVATPSN